MTVLRAVLYLILIFPIFLPWCFKDFRDPCQKQVVYVMFSCKKNNTS